MKDFPQISPEVDVEEDIELQHTDLWELVVFNDEVNTFVHVIETLMDICEHTPHQAEQCTLLIHYKGKCSVKNGEFDTLAAMRNAICGRGITAEVMLK